MKSTLISIISFFLVSSSFGQLTLSGTVTDASGEGVPGITVQLKGSKKGSSTDIDGYYILKGLTTGTYKLQFTGVGFNTTEHTVSLTKSRSIAPVQLEESTTELAAVQILGKSEATEIREQAYAVEVVNSKGFKNLSTNANDILGKISGINIRQSGGLGSQFSLSLNGLSGNQLRMFLDGVPMDYFGSSLSLNNFSANLIERIEVYKGVVPVHLSSDALGGAINVVTGKKNNSFLDASYSLGSFNTHIGSLNGQYRDQNTGFTVRLKSFYNTSQNNYKVPVNLVNFETGKEEKETTWVERFHDAYESKMAWVETGFINAAWMDQFMVGVMYSENFKELQQPANAIGQANIPYGEVSNQEKKVITNLSMSKLGLLNDRLNIHSYAVGVFSENISLDTSSYRYDWFGDRQLKTNTSTGEIENRKTWLTMNIENYLANVNAEYSLSRQHNIVVNYSLNHLNIKGSDPFKAANNTQFSQPSTVVKQVAGLSYTQSFFGERLKNSFFTKAYNYRLSSLETNYQGTDLIPFEQNKDYLGFGFSSTLQFQKFQLKASYENATRFPELVELFGDGLNIDPSPQLLPEQSSNYNLGFIYNSRKPNNLTFSLNGFIRDSEDFILPQIKGIKMYHINLGKALSRGVDLSSSYMINRKFTFSFNGTYLDKRDNNQWRNGQEGVPNSQYRVRVPNEPYLFGNFTFAYRHEDLFSNGDNFSLSLIENYVHEFYYRWPNLASQGKGTVPDQWTTNVDFVYSLQDERYNFSFGIANLWDAKVYDNYLQLRPGRTYNFKIRYFINNN